jgi:uncharacterized protein YjhX (UPF0386 family)
MFLNAMVLEFSTKFGWLSSFRRGVLRRLGSLTVFTQLGLRRVIKNSNGQMYKFSKIYLNLQLIFP